MTMHDGMAERVYALEAKDEIRRLMAAYVHARDFAKSSIDNYFTEDAIWEGVDEQVRRRWPHLAGMLAPRVGRDAIVERFAGPLRPCCTCSQMSRSPLTVMMQSATGPTFNPRF
jgi:hypothetical protein